MNGDGYADLIVAERGSSIFVFHGAAIGLPVQTVDDFADTTLGPFYTTDFSLAVADVNGDGFDDVVVGDPFHAENGQFVEQGAVFVFFGSALGIPDANKGTADQKLDGDQYKAHFGIGLAGAGDVNGDGFDDLLVGANGYDLGETDEGAVFVFHGGAAGLVGSGPAGAASVVDSDQPSAFLGEAIAGAGDVNGDGHDDVLIGSRRHTGGAGAAALFHGSATGITSGALGSGDALVVGASGRFGELVAAAGDVDADGYDDVLVAASSEPSPAFRGVVYLFRGSAAGVTAAGSSAADARIEGEPGSYFGTAFAGGDDVDADGYDDVLVAGRIVSDGHYREGVAYLFLGGPAGLPTGSSSLADVQIQVDEEQARVGSALALGDVDADGFADAMVGVPDLLAWPGSDGLAMVFAGGPGGLPKRGTAFPAAEYEGPVRLAGDVNGDGLPDLLIGDSGFGGHREGAVYLRLGLPGGLPAAPPALPDAQFIGGSDDAELGFDFYAGVGDVDGDGYDDIAITGFDSVLFYLGGSGGIASDTGGANADAQISGVGGAVGAAGDLDGDGYDDVAVGFRNAAPDFTGVAYVFRGGAAGLPSGGPEVADTVLDGTQAEARFGFWVGGVGDVNGDGWDDLLVTASRWNAVNLNNGAAFLYLGSAAGIPSGDALDADARIEGSRIHIHFGEKGADHGDLDGDPYSDVLIGAKGRWGEGESYVFHGGPSGLPSIEADAASTVLTSRQDDSKVSHPAVGDVDGDELDDLAIGGAFVAGSSAFGSVFVHRAASGFASGSYLARADLVTLGTGGSRTYVADLDVDGYEDVIAGTRVYRGGADGAAPAPCENGVDDDGDGDADFPADAGCAEPEAIEDPVCSNGLDDDGDGLTDHPADPGCPTPFHPKEDPGCNDGIDNDSDGRIDWPIDEGCKEPWQEDEVAPVPVESCGLGPGLPVIVALLASLRRRRRRRR